MQANESAPINVNNQVVIEETVMVYNKLLWCYNYAIRKPKQKICSNYIATLIIGRA